MKSYSRYLICVASLLFAAVLPASAGSITYNNSLSMSGASESVTAMFTLTTGKITDTISAGVLNFTGALGNFSVNFSGSCGASSSTCGISFLYLLNGDTGTYNINLSKMTASGSLSGFAGWKAETGKYSYSLAVPEGGSRFAYLAPAGLVIFGGMFLSGFFRQRPRSRARV